MFEVKADSRPQLRGADAAAAGPGAGAGGRGGVRVAIASHNLRSVAHAIAYDALRGGDGRDLELQVLRGLGDALRRGARGPGLRVRTYCPVGDLVAGMAYLVRRLLENTSNESLPRRAGEGRAARGAAGAAAMKPFANEPVLELRRAPVRAELADALAALDAAGAARRAGLDRRRTRARVDALVSTDPGAPDRVVARAAAATEAEVDAARRARPPGSRALGGDARRRARARCWSRAAAWLRERRLELAALEVRECAKPWPEADADVCEAIDFLEYYARGGDRAGRGRRRCCRSPASATR